MSFLESIYHHKWAFTKISVMTILFIYLILHLILVYGHSYIKKNWVTLREKPYLAPLAGFFQQDTKGIGIIEMGVKSVMQLLWNYIKMFFKVLIKPFQYIISIIYKIIDGIKITLNKFRQQLGVIRKLLLAIIVKVMERLQNLAATFIEMFMKLRDVMKRSFATYQMMVYTMETMGLTLKSMMSGPIGDLAHLAADLGYVFTYFLFGPMSFAMFPSLWYCVFCFSPETKICLQNNNNKAIKDITFRDHLIGGDLEGILVFYEKEKSPLYRYKGDIVKGEHYVFHNNKQWTNVNKIGEATLINNFSNLVYCLSTSNHRIMTPNATYLDFCETSQIEILLRQKNRALALLNGHNHIKASPEHLYGEGFYHDGISFSDITAKDLPYIEDTYNNNIIGIGKWKVNNDIKWYQHLKSGIITTGSLIIYEGDNWLPVHQSKNFSQINNPEILKQIKYFSHWTSQTGVLKFPNLITRDLLEVHNIKHHSICSKEALNLH